MSLNIEVLKFGGTSVGDAEAFRQSCRVIERHKETGKGIVVVVSAMAGVTNKLHEAYDFAIRGDIHRSYEVIENIIEQHMGVLYQLNSKIVVQPAEEKIRHVTNEVKDVLYALSLFPDNNPKHKDLIVSAGERISPYLMGAALQSMGPAVVLDSAQVMKTDSRFGDANPHFELTAQKVRELVSPELEAGKVIVMGGYYGTDALGNITTFDRGGSDFTATVMGRILDNLGYTVLEVDLYKADVDGVFTTNPKIVKAAHLVPHLTRDEASALAILSGYSSVIHPRAIRVLPKKTPMRCRGTFHPDNLGTLIDHHILEDDPPIKAVTILPHSRLISVHGPGMDQSGIAVRILSELSDINIRAISQPPTEQVMHIVIPGNADVDPVIASLRNSFQDRMKVGDIEAFESENVSAVGIVGDGVSRPEVLMKVFEAMNQHPQVFHRNGASKKNGSIFIGPGDHQYTIFIREEEGERATAVVQTLHQVLFENQ